MSPKNTSKRNLRIAVTSWNYSGELSRQAYREGYWEAANTLVEHLERVPLKSEGWTRIGLIYPVMYLYQHYVEITIKDAVALAESFTWVGTARPKRLGHSLLDLWRELLANVKMLQGDEPACELDTLHGGLVGKLHAIDPFGDSFRYPLNTSGKAQFQMNLEIDLLEMREKVSRFHDAISELDYDFRKLIDPDDEDASDRTYFY
jgi:hypothetical protein